MPVMLARRISDVISDISIYNVSDYTTLIMNGVTSLTSISLTERSVLTRSKRLGPPF